MKNLVILFVLVALSFASDDGCTDSSIDLVPHGSGSDAISLTLLNNWTLADKALGLDVLVNGTSTLILGTDNMADVVRGYDVTGAVVTAQLDLDPSNDSCFGLAWNNNVASEAYYTNDWGNTNLFYTDDFGTSWTTSPNPATISGRGMDFDGTDYWQTNGDGGGLWRFQPGVGQENIPISEPPTAPSGLTVFPYNGNLGIAVTTYNTHYIYFYEWDGSSISFIGSVACPIPVNSSFGLAYSSLSGTMYWSFKDSSSQYHLAEFSFDISATLEQSSWGSIKSSF